MTDVGIPATLPTDENNGDLSPRERDTVDQPPSGPVRKFLPMKPRREEIMLLPQSMFPRIV